MRWADSPEQAEFRRGLRARTRQAAEADDENWERRPSWEYSALLPKRKTGPPQMANPSPGVLAARRYRERLKLRRQAEASTLSANEGGG